MCNGNTYLSTYSVILAKVPSTDNLHGAKLSILGDVVNLLSQC